MIDKNLYQRILIEPAEKQDADQLTIVSGYATASMMVTHYAKLVKRRPSIGIDLTIGMTPSDGLAVAHHRDALNHALALEVVHPLVAGKRR